MILVTYEKGEFHNTKIESIEKIDCKLNRNDLRISYYHNGILKSAVISKNIIHSINVNY